MKRLLITGGSRGLGLAICRRMLADGWQVVTNARTPTPAMEALSSEHPGQFQFHALDLAERGAADRLAEATGALAGFDAFVANAAVGTEGLLTLTPEAAIRDCVEVNLVATLLLTRQVVKGMLDRGGSLLFISSVAARTGLTGLSVYAATKGGLVAFSRAVAREYGSRGIRANCILPGFLETEMTSSLGAGLRERVRRRSALQRLGHPEDVVDAVRFLLSDEAKFITGTEMVVDGGFTA